MTMTEQPKGGRWPWRELLPTSAEEAVELRGRALDAGYSRTVAGGFMSWCLDLVDGVDAGRSPVTVARYRRMLVELAPAEKLEHLTQAA